MAGVQDVPRGAARAWLALFCLTAILGGALVSAQSAPEGAPAGEDMVVDLRVTGNDRFTTERIIRLIHTRANRPYDADLVEEDVRRLIQSRMFLHASVSTQEVAGGRVVIFKVVEKPVMQYVKYVGCEKVKKKVLGQQTGLKSYEAIDPYSVIEGRRKIEDYYQSKGFGKVHVTIFEGDKPNDRGVVYIIHEGPKQRVLWTQFEGNKFADDGRLRTQIKSKPGFLWLFGTLDRKQIDEDVNRLTAYYRSMGFFQAKVGRELAFDEAKRWLTLTFVVDEGPRYQVREVRVLGNKIITAGELTQEMKLTAGKPFNQNEMAADALRMQDMYGAIGHVFADVKPVPQFLDEPGVLDLVYQIKEGNQYRVGKIDVQIKGDNPHTRISTVLNQMSIYPGQIVDVRELRASEGRIKRSQLFENNPTTGSVPKITFTPPDLERTDPDKEESAVARRPRAPSGFRGQSPDPPPNGSEDAWQPAASGPSVPAPRPAAPAQGGSQLRWGPSAQNSAVVRAQYTEPVGSAGVPAFSSAAPATPQAWPTGAAAGSPMVYRGQNGTYDPSAGYSVPPLAPGASTMRGPLPTAGYPTTPMMSGPEATATPYAAGQPPYDNTQGLGQPGMPMQGPPGPDPGTRPVAASPGLFAPPRQGDYPAAAPSPAFGGDELGPTAGEPPLFLPLRPELAETMTGKLMLSVGVNSDAGLLGSVVIDEQNFDWTRWPSSWREITDGRAWRGDGQKFRFEAMPGTQLQRYSVQFTEPYLFDTKVSETLSAFYYDRRYREWTERRAGTRVALGYQFLPDLWGTVAYRFEDVHVSDPIVRGRIPDLDEVLGSNTLHGFRAQLTRDTRDSQHLATEGYLFELGFEQVIGSFQYPRADYDFRKHFLLRQHPDGSGRHVLSFSSRGAISGDDTPIYDRYFAGGFSTIRGFEFRGVSPREFTVPLGGDLSLLNSIEYLFPITADDMLRGVVFCDTGTIQPSISDWNQRYRVAPGVGLRISIPAMGPAPIALDFAVPIVQEPGDQKQVFSFFVGWMR